MSKNKTSVSAHLRAFMLEFGDDIIFSSDAFYTILYCKVCEKILGKKFTMKHTYIYISYKTYKYSCAVERRNLKEQN